MSDNVTRVTSGVNPPERELTGQAGVGSMRTGSRRGHGAGITVERYVEHNGSTLSSPA